MFVDAYQNHSVVAKQAPRQLQAWIHHVEPVGVEAAGGFRIGGEFVSALVHLAGELEVVFDVVLEVIGIDEVLAGVVGRVDVDELYLSGIALLEQLEDFEVVALDHEVLRRVPVDAVLVAQGRSVPVEGVSAKLSSAAFAVPIEAILLLSLVHRAAKQLLQHLEVDLSPR